MIGPYAFTKATNSSIGIGSHRRSDAPVWFGNTKQNIPLLLNVIEYSALPLRRLSLSIAALALVDLMEIVVRPVIQNDCFNFESLQR